MEKGDSNLDDLYRDFADRFRALSQLFGQLGSPERAQELLDSLISEDAEAFTRLVDRVDYPMQVGKCFWVREIVERIVSTPSGFVEECWLRDDLTLQERMLFFQIAFRHRQVTPVAGGMEVTLRDGRSIIPAGPFLDELKANGLVTCALRMTYDTSTTLGLSKPERICI
jgi:hypothetical protein